MGNLAFSTPSPEKIAIAIEQMIQKELGLKTGITFEIKDQNTAKTSLHTILGDVGNALFTGTSETLFNLNFTIEGPKPAQIMINIARQGIGARGEAIVFTTSVNKSVKSDVFLEAPKTFGVSKFGGDIEAAAKLNAIGALLKRANLFSRVQADIGGFTVRIERFFKISPKEDGNGSELVVVNLPKMVSMGFSALIDIREFLDITSIIESVL